MQSTHRPDDEVRDAQVVGFGGMAAEVALLGEGSLGGRGDVSSATETALARIAAGLADDHVAIDLDWLGRNVADSLKESQASALVAQLAAARVIAIAIVRANVEPIRRFCEPPRGGGRAEWCRAPERR